MALIEMATEFRVMAEHSEGEGDAPDGPEN
jgi:hypothetical protein